MNIKEKIYKHLPNPSDIEDVMGEISESTCKDTIAASHALCACLDSFYEIKKIVDSIELSQEDNQ